MTERELLEERLRELDEERAQIKSKLGAADAAPQLFIVLPATRTYSTSREAVRKRLQRAKVAARTAGTTVPSVPAPIRNARAAPALKCLEEASKHEAKSKAAGAAAPR